MKPSRILHNEHIGSYKYTLAVSSDSNRETLELFVEARREIKDVAALEREIQTLKLALKNSALVAPAEGEPASYVEILDKLRAVWQPKTATESLPSEGTEQRVPGESEKSPKAAIKRTPRKARPSRERRI